MARTKKGPPERAADILERFPITTGGIASALGCSAQSVRYWRVSGIPCRWHTALLGLAGRIGMDGLTRDMLEDASPDVVRLPPEPRKPAAAKRAAA